MTPIQRDILLVILKSQKEIVQVELKVVWSSDTQNILQAELNEINRQIKITKNE